MSKVAPPHFATLTVPADDHRAAARHGKIQHVVDDIYMVRGKMPSTPSRPLFERLFLYYSRTMTILRRRNDAGDYELTLINSVRLNDGALQQLAKLGAVKHVVRLGSFHGVDDAFYVQNYTAKYWVVDGMNNATGLAVEPEILSKTNLPIDDADLFSFDDLPYPEAIIVLQSTRHRGGVAITTDAIQNHRSVFDIDNSPLVSLAIWRIGLVGKARLGPIWLREQAAGSEAGIGMAKFFKPQFERLLAQYDFDMLMPGHGWPIHRDTKAAIQSSVDAQLSNYE